MRGFIKRGLAAILATAALSGVAMAQSGPVVTLKSFDGFTQLRGELLNFDGEVFTIRTGLGIIQVSALQVNCEGENCPTNLLFGSEFGIYGSNTIGAALMPALIEGYAESLDASLVREIGAVENERTLRIMHQNGKEMAAIDLRAHGSGTAYPGLATGQALLGMSSRLMKEAEAQLLRQAGIDELRGTDNEHIVALDGLIIITHPDNPVRSISLEQVADVFAGTITNWSELGGPNRPISIYARDDKSGTFDTFNALVLDAYGVEIAPSARRFEDSFELSDNVANDINALGFVGAAYARAAKVLAIRQECGLLSLPTTFAMKTEEYPLTRKLYVYSRPGTRDAHAKGLVEFMGSAAAHPYVEESGFISLGVEAQGMENQGIRLAYGMSAEDEFSLPVMREMLLNLRDAQRLSITFRFRPGSSLLDPQSQRAAQDLALALANGAYASKELMLIGFTDSIGQFDLNRGLAVRRAQGVLDIMKASVTPGALDNLPLLVQGYGELTPVGCNTSFQGRVANRRVEVWVRERPRTN